MKKKIIKIVVCIMCMVMVGVSMVIVSSAYEVTSNKMIPRDKSYLKMGLKYRGNKNIELMPYSDSGVMEFSTALNGVQDSTGKMYLIVDRDNVSGYDPAVTYSFSNIRFEWECVEEGSDDIFPCVIVYIYLDGEEVIVLEHVDDGDNGILTVVNRHTGITSTWTGSQGFDMAFYFSFSWLKSFECEESGLEGIQEFVNIWSSCDITSPGLYNEGYNDGYDEGYGIGIEDGYNSGVSDGYDEGYEEGEKEGYSNGQEDGYDSGYVDGYAEGNEYGYKEGKEDGYEVGYKEGYDIGSEDGYITGFSDGHDEGYAEGNEYGYKEGKEDGYEVGYKEGYDAGGSEIYDLAYNDGYDVGYEYGVKVSYSTGYDCGYAEGYKVGFPKGQEDMGKTMESFKDMVFAVFDAPSRLIDSMLNFDIFGINMAGLVKTLITLAVVGLIVFAIWKVKG